MIDLKGKTSLALVEQIEGAGIQVWTDADGVQCSHPEAAQAIIDAFDQKAWELTQVIPAIKEEARKRIVSVLPEWKQANATARAVELVSLGQASGPEWEAMQSAWAWVKAVRAHSDILEAQAALLDHPLTLDITAGWPE